MAEPNSKAPEPINPKDSPDHSASGPAAEPTSGDSSPQSSERANPFIGPRAYQTGERLFGRERETSQLFNLLMANRVMLLFSPSGAGKSSLIYAALIPELKKENFNPLPVMRVNQEPPSELKNLPGFNRYIFSALSMLEENLPKEEQLPAETLAQITLEAYGSRFDGTRSVLIFDQFEEIMTQDPTDLDAKREFFRQTAALLRHPTLRALFAMREDHLASLDPFKQVFPVLFANPFRLDLLTRTTSVQVLQQIAEQEKVDFHKDAAEKLAEDLSQVNLQLPDNTLASRPGIYVEPVQLQVVGYNLWQKLEPGDQDITLSEIKAIGDVDQSLGAYYDQQMASVVQKTEVRERFMREWIDQALITANKIRTQVLRGSEAKYGVSPEAAEALENARLIRAEARRGAVWYELAHDRLVSPVKKRNARWFDEHLSLLQKQFRLWKEEQTHKGSLLLREAGLEQAQAWAEAHPDDLTDEEQEFLAQSSAVYQAEIEAQQRQERELEEQKRTSGMLKRRFRIAVIALAIALVLAVISAGLLIYSSIQEERLAEQEQISESGNFAGLAIAANQDGYSDLALLLAVHAYDRYDSFQARSAMLQLLNANAKIKQMMRGHVDRVSGIAVKPDGTQMASVGWDDTLRFWDVGPLGLMEARTLTIRDVEGVAFSPTGALMATSGCAERDESGARCLTGIIQLWNPATAEIVGEPITVPDKWILDVAFSPDGQRLASINEDGRVQIWDVEQGLEVMSLGDPGHFSFQIAFNHDAKQPILATTGCAAFGGESGGCASGLIILWDIATGENIAELSGGEDWLNSVAFSPDDTLLASGGDDGMVRLWDLSTGEEIEPALEGHQDPVNKVVFDSTGSILASTGNDNRLIIWNIDDHTMLFPPFERGSSAPTTLAAIPNEDQIWFASGAEDGELLLWQIDFQDPQETETEFLDFRINDLALIPGTDQVLIASCEEDADYRCLSGLVYLYDLQSSQVMDSFQAGEHSITAVAASETGLIATGSCIEGDEFSELADGSLDYTPCTEAEIVLWDAATRQKIDVTLAHTQYEITDLAFSPDGEYLAAGARDGSIGVWNTADWTDANAFFNAMSDEFYEDILTVYGLAFTPDSQRLLIAVCLSGGYYDTCRNGEIRVVNLGDSSVEDPLRRTGIHPGKLDFSQAESSGLAASLDCTAITENGCENSVTLWYVNETDALPMSSLNLQPSWLLSSMILAPDGKILLTGSSTGQLTRWDIDPNSWRERACQIAGRNLTETEVYQYKAYSESCKQWK